MISELDRRLQWSESWVGNLLVGFTALNLIYLEITSLLVQFYHLYHRPQCHYVTSWQSWANLVLTCLGSEERTYDVPLAVQVVINSGHTSKWLKTAPCHWHACYYFRQWIMTAGISYTVTHLVQLAVSNGDLCRIVSQSPQHSPASGKYPFYLYIA